MNNYLNTYEIELTTKSPVFVGDGKEIGKKEYVFLSDNAVGVLDIEKLYAYLKSKGKKSAFEEYMVNNNRDNLNTWLLDQKIPISEIKSMIKYELKSCDKIDKRARGLQVMSFVKDPFGMPYIPGSSLKGMLRTILVSQEIMKNREKYNEDADAIENEIDPTNTRKTNRKKLLTKEVASIEAKSFRLLERPQTKSQDAVNDIMQGFVVSDSMPLSVDDLALCQRVEVHKDGKEKTLPQLRESIKPETKVRFKLTIDSSVCNYDAEEIVESIKGFANQYYENFLIKFNENKPADNTVYLGGGVGFLSKTFIYPLFETSGVSITTGIFYKTGVGDKHRDDRRLGLSPHVLKCTHYDGKRFQFGQCELNIKKLH